MKNHLNKGRDTLVPGNRSLCWNQEPELMSEEWDKFAKDTSDAFEQVP
jgi:hypothetical protein